MTTAIQAAADAEYKRVFAGVEPDPDALARLARWLGPDNAISRWCRQQEAARPRDDAA